LERNLDLSFSTIYFLHPAATRLTTIEVEVEELWTATVTKMPIMRPTIGLLSKGWLKMLPEGVNLIKMFMIYFLFLYPLLGLLEAEGKRTTGRGSR